MFRTADRTYEVGSVVHLRAKFRDLQTGKLYLPTVVTLEIRDEDEVLSTHVYGVDPDLAREDSGAHDFPYLITTDGWTRFSWTASGNGDPIVKSGRFYAAKKAVNR